MNTQRVFAFILMVALLFLVGCSKSLGDKKLSKEFLELLSSVTINTIDLDEIPIQTVYCEPFFRIDNKAKEERYTLGFPASFVLVQDSFYICDRINNVIGVADKQGLLTRTIGKKGRGPSEFIMPTQIVANDSLFLVYDFGNNRVQLFSRQITYLFSVIANHPPTGPSIFASKEKIFICKPFGSKKVVEMHANTEKKASMGAFLPEAFVIDSKTSSSLGNLKLTGDGEGSIFIAYVTLPYLLIFDEEGTLLRAISFRGKAIDRIMKLNEGNNDVPTRVTFLFNSIRITDNGKIALAVGSSIFVLSNNTKNVLEKNLALRHIAGGKYDEDYLVPIVDFQISGTILYVADAKSGSILRASLN